jgi:uncharacterized protein
VRTLLCCRRLASFFLSLVLALTLEAAHQASSPDKHTLWKVKSSKGTTYVLGSVHLLKKENYPLPEALEKAFDETHKLVLEVNLDSVSNPAAQQLMLSKGLDTSLTTLEQRLSPETYALARKEIEAIGLGLDQVRFFKPWMLGLTLTVMHMQKMGFDPNFGIDKHFFDKAKKAQREILNLETVEDQLNRLDGMSAKTQEAFLLQTLKDMHTVEKEFNDILSAWRAGDTRVLENSLLDSFSDYPEAYDKLIKERNYNWLPQVESFLQQGGDYLVVVGASHLLGKDGLIELLRQKGHSPEQL